MRGDLLGVMGRVEAERQHYHARRRAAADRAARAAETAIQRGEWVEAERAINRGAIYRPAHPRLTELRARCALHHGRFAEAADALERIEPTGAGGRLLQALARTQSGQKDRAHLQLRDRAREAEGSPPARQLLAWLELERGDSGAAERTIGAEEWQQAETADRQLRVLAARRAGRRPEAERAAGRLAHAAPKSSEAMDWLRSFGPELHPADAPVPPELVQRLAGQLARRPQVIDSLVVAQRHRPEAHRIALLRPALARCAETAADPLPALRGAAELALLADDADDAQRWARRGLERSPYSAPLAMLLERAERQARPSEAASADDSLEALERVAVAHPRYPDVQRALVFRYQRAGREEDARRWARRWARRQPDQPLARRTAAELAA